MTASDVVYVRFVNDGSGWTIENYGDHPLDGDKFMRVSESLVALIEAAKELLEFGPYQNGHKLQRAALTYARSLKGAAE